jgi:hypothetical protein
MKLPATLLRLDRVHVGVRDRRLGGGGRPGYWLLAVSCLPGRQSGESTTYDPRALERALKH